MPQAVLLGEAELAAMGDAAQEVQSKRVAALRSSSRWGKYLTPGAKGLQLDAKAIKAAEHGDGKFVVHGNDDSLSAEEALGCQQMIRVEQAWRDMKSTLDMRPVFRGAPLGGAPRPRARGHHGAVAAAGAHRRARLRRHVAQCRRPPAAHPARAIVEPSRYGVAGHRPDTAKCLKSLQIKPPPPILQLA